MLLQQQTNLHSLRTSKVTSEVHTVQFRACIRLKNVPIFMISEAYIPNHIKNKFFYLTLRNQGSFVFLQDSVL